jgi:heavy metal translocating P-type ATPase
VESYMKALLRFGRQYKLFALALAALAAGLILQFARQATAAHWVLNVVALAEVLPLLWDMFQDFRSGSYGIDILAATAVVASVVLNQPWAALVVVLMLTGGESLEDFAERRANTELFSLLQRAPLTARVIRNRKMLEVPIKDVHVGDKLVIRPGEVVPVDAVILEGTASFDEASLTGESLPQPKTISDTIVSGTVDLDGAITAKALARAADSQYEQIIRLVRAAAGSKSPFVRLADRYSLPFTFMAYAIAVAVWVISGHAIRFLEVIIVATPCPLLLAAPIALISGMSRASKYGIVVKTGSALERLAEAQTIAFDKTGTLTKGQLTVTGVKSYGELDQDGVLSLAAGLEQNSNHVAARAVVASAQAQKLNVAKAKHVRELAGRGLQAAHKGREVLVGRLELMQERGVALPKGFKPDTFKQTVVYVAIDDKLAGAISLEDELRPDSQATLERLRRLGLRRTLLVTGDNQATAQAIATSIGIEEVHAEMLPADKLHLIEKLPHRPSVFVGDGINDAPVLTRADVGIALGARGSTAASESADLVILTDDIGRVATAYAIARRTFQIARQSILAGIGLSIILMLIFATGKFPPLLGAILQEVVDVVVIFNALRAHSITAERTA